MRNKILHKFLWKWFIMGQLCNNVSDVTHTHQYIFPSLFHSPRFFLLFPYFLIIMILLNLFTSICIPLGLTSESVCIVINIYRSSFRRGLLFFLSLFIYLFIFYFYFFYCSGFCHTLKWISHGFTCVPCPDPPSHLPLHPIPLILSYEGFWICL